MSAPIIEAIETRILDVPLIRPHGFATFTANEQPILLVQVKLSDGST
ncbi:MAG: chloromuconate cycloisomerase, partial [Corynebacterium casei]|nr:chloromuconate cycloisomerase [Corynebacterium casei]